MAKQSNITALLLIGGALLYFSKKDKPGIGRVTQKELKAAGGYEHLERVINFAGSILRQAPDTVLYVYDKVLHFVYNNGTGNAKIRLDNYSDRDYKIISYYFFREYKGPVQYRNPMAPVEIIVRAKAKVSRRNEALHAKFDEQINRISENANYYNGY